MQLTKDESYWSEKPHIPAATWVAAGARGQPVVASEAAAKAHVPGLQDSNRGNTPPGRRRLANRDKGAARKRKHLSDMDELKSFRQGHGSGKGHVSRGGKDSGGKGEKEKQRSVRNTHMLLVGYGHGNLWKASSRSRMCQSGQTCA